MPDGPVVGQGLAGAPRLNADPPKPQSRTRALAKRSTSPMSDNSKVVASEAKQKTCFTIMPFSVRDGDLDRYAGDKGHWSEVYQGLIIPAVEEAGLICRRDDDDSASRLITEGIWGKLENADVVLCDLSATNPNVFLELGWALRADQKFVLIKDELTQFQFDLNQYFTYTYSHKLRPKRLARDIDGLHQTLVKTLADTHRKYSIVKRLGMEMSAIQASQAGDFETLLLQEIRDDIRSLRSKSVFGSKLQAIPEPRHPKPRIQATDWASLHKQLMGTQWINTRNGDTLIFIDRQFFLLRRPGDANWRRLRYEPQQSFPRIILQWSDLGASFADTLAEFNDSFVGFLEGDHTSWAIA